MISHLDLVRLFDRALRRAALPISFTNGFHPTPRIAIAQALPLGVTSVAEVVDFELARPLAAGEFRDRLAAELPPELPLYEVADLDLKSPSANQLILQATYQLTFVPSTGWQEDQQAAEIESQWRQILQTTLAQTEFHYEYQTKSKKTQVINLRDRLDQLEFVSFNPGLAQAVSQSHDPALPSPAPRIFSAASVTIQYQGACRADGTSLKHEHVMWMLEQISGLALQLLKTHRLDLVLQPEISGVPGGF